MRVQQVRCVDIRPTLQLAADQWLELEELADSIRRHGVLRPVLLQPGPDGYVIVHGERRWRAAQIAGLEEIPAWLVDDLARDASLVAQSAGRRAPRIEASTLAQR